MKENLRNFRVNEGGIGVSRESGLERFDVDEFGIGREEGGGGETGGNEGFAEAGVGGPYGVDRV